MFTVSISDRPQLASAPRDLCLVLDQIKGRAGRQRNSSTAVQKREPGQRPLNDQTREQTSLRKGGGQQRIRLTVVSLEWGGSLPKLGATGGWQQRQVPPQTGG